MKHTTHNGHNLATKNKLQTAIQEYLNGIDRILIENANDLKEFKLKVLADIMFFNNEYPRCKAVKASWFEIDKNDYLLSGVDFNHFMIHHVKKTYKAVPISPYASVEKRTEKNIKVIGGFVDYLKFNHGIEISEKVFVGYFEIED
ncbi:MAG TPA: hypothetical protein VLY84_00125 [Dysgonamonadaceae bacterium]|nr:hypothetical protein [Dysgonamonadaceae bacterium]